MRVHCYRDARMSGSTEARREDSKHVLYEIEMFCALARYFETGEVDDAVKGLDREGIVVRNAIIEAFQIHARQLIELLDEKQRTKDWNASDFTREPWQFELDATRLTDWERFSQRVAHLSRKRATFTLQEQQVETRRIRLDLGADIEEFLKAIDESLVCEDFLARARAALAASEPLPEAPASEWLHGAAAVGATESVVTYPGGTAIIPPDLHLYGPVTSSTTSFEVHSGAAVFLDPEALTEPEAEEVDGGSKPSA